MPEIVIKATNLSKEFVRSEKDSGIKGAVKNLFFAKKR